MKNLFNKIGLLLGIIFFTFSLWQLDLLFSPYIWKNNEWKQLWTINYWLFPNMIKGQAYDILFGLITLSFIITIISLWTWSD